MEQKVTLKVIGTRRDNSRSYYMVNYMGREFDVKMFNFQAKSPTPVSEIKCMAKDDGNGNITLTQDLVPIVNQLYKVGETYPFQVVSIQNSNYIVCDTNGLRFWMTEYSSDPFIGQYVKCSVTSIKNGYHMFLKLEEKQQRQIANSLFFSFETLFNKCELSEELQEKISTLINTDENLSEIKNLYNSKNEAWMLNFVECIDNLVLWSEDSNCDVYLPVFKNLCLLLLEKSNYLKNLSKTNREDWQKRLSVVLRKTEDYELAFHHLNNHTEEEYLAEQLKNLKESEYLYQPERKLRTILCIFNQKEDLMAEKMENIFQIILGGTKDNWQAEPFRSAFVDMLEMFINAYRKKATRDANGSLISKLIKAIAIQLLLVNENDDVDRRYNRSTLYRMLSYIKRMYSEELLRASYRCLFHTYQEKLEYEWHHINNLEHLYLQISNELIMAQNLPTIQEQAYNGNNISMLVRPQGISIRPENRLTKKLVNSLPDKLISWEIINVLTDSKPITKIKKQKDINKHATFWREIEQSLDTVKDQRNLNIKVEPERNKSGYAVKVLYANEDSSAFYCRLQDEHVEGEGWLNLKEIIKYNIYHTEELMNCFKDENGAPMYLPARVISGPDEEGLYRFSMLEEIKKFFFEDSDGWSLGSTITMYIKDVSGEEYQDRYYVGIADCGLSCRMSVNHAPFLKAGDYVEATIIDRTNTGQFICKYLDNSRSRFNSIEALKELMLNVRYDSSEFDDVDEDTLPDELMSVEYVEEIIGILDRQSVISKSREETYAYLSIAGILSKMLNNKDSMEYYEQRKSILKMFYDYEKSGKVDEEKLTEFINTADNELIQSDYMINEAITKFRILDSLKNDTGIDNLIQIRTTTHNEAIRDAADLAISVLLTSRFGLPNVKRQLVDTINEELGVKAYIAERKNYGIESQTVEFKTSIVYPADNNMQPETNLQGAEIMKVICGFLNSDEGGTLYLGVSDLGVATGVQNDMKYLLRNEDGYGRYVHNLINRELGTIANQCTLNSEWEEDEGYKVYMVHVKPAPELIRYKGAVWIRQDTEKRRLPEEDLESFTRMHQRAYEKYMEKHKEEIIAEVAVEYEETEEKQPQTEKAYYEIATSKWRNNTLFDYEANFVASPRFLHFLPKEQYKLTDEPTYEETHLQLAIHEDETDGYLVLGYGKEAGNVLIVEMNKLMMYDLNKRLPRNGHERAIFAAPAKRNDGVLTAWKNTHNELCVRIDDIQQLIELHHDGDMSDPGMTIPDTKFNEFCFCEIVPEIHLARFNKYRKQGGGLGQKIKSINEINLFRELLGINVAEL